MSKRKIAHVRRYGEYFKAFEKDGRVVVFEYDNGNHRMEVEWKHLHYEVKDEIVKQLNLKIK